MDLLPDHPCAFGDLHVDQAGDARFDLEELRHAGTVEVVFDHGGRGVGGADAHDAAVLHERDVVGIPRDGDHALDAEPLGLQREDGVAFVVVRGRDRHIHLVRLDLLQDLLSGGVALEDGHVVAVLELLAALLVLFDERDLVLRRAKDHSDAVLLEQPIGDVAAQIASAHDQYVHAWPPIRDES